MTERSDKRDKPPPADHNRPYEVVENLYISGHPDHSQEFMRRGIHAVIDLEGDVDASIAEAEGQGETTLYLYWPVEDGPMPNERTVRGIASFVARLLAQGSPVLVHCKAGHNRSGLICARTLIEQGMEPDEAIRTVREKRGDGHALTNDRFVAWLRQERPPGAG
ncbi:MAG TPA: dual specificity protein phosphatase family protein [Actinomycetota bacterium]|nr:dual specificity protein phosphatase family protein [Actinomycetota bacterium]